LLFLVSY